VSYVIAFYTLKLYKNNFAGGLFVLEGIIRPVSASALTRFIRSIFYGNLCTCNYD